MVECAELQWQYDEENDVNDGKPWSAADLEDLALALKDGGTIEGAAHWQKNFQNQAKPHLSQPRL